MAKYRNKFRLSHVLLAIKNSLTKKIKGDVPTYVLVDVMNRIHKGEREIIISMCRDGVNKSVVEYLNEYHCYINRAWDLEFLGLAFTFISERISRKLGKFSDIDVEILDISDTDKRVIIKMK